jgi:hypothetical protein
VADKSPVVDKKYRRSLPYMLLGFICVLGLCVMTVWGHSEYQSTQDPGIPVLLFILWAVVLPPALVIVLDSIVGYVSIGSDSIRLRSIFSRQTIDFERVTSVKDDPEGLVLLDASGKKIGKVYFVTSNYKLIKCFLQDTFNA